MRQLSLFDELVVDNFAGGGGASTGIEMALGRPVDIAINHDPEAVAMHAANHPHTRHFCESVWDVDPRKVTNGKPVGFAWFSPDCKHFSKAKGGKPRDKGIRGLAWVAVRWAATVQPRIMFLENVEEFLTWGPLGPDGQPKPDQKGRTFRTFINALKRLGYTVEWKELRACDYGAPTTRKRLFLIARRDGLPIVWPEPTHGAPNSAEVKAGKRKPWRTAAECIDWSIPCPSIFEREKPLAEATLRRIARGIIKYVIEAKQPFIVTCNHAGEGFRGQSLQEPFKTITAARDAHGLVVPTIMPIDHQSSEGCGTNPAQPLTTITAKARHAVVVPTLIQTGYGERDGQAPRVPGLDKPLGTIMAEGQKHAVACATLIKHYGGNYTGAGNSLDEPLSTITTQDHNSLATVNLVRQFGNSDGADVSEPVGAITAGGGGKTNLVVSNLVKLYGTSTGCPVTEPMPTVTSGGQHIGEVRAFLTKYYSQGGSCQPVDEPTHTITTKDRMAVVTIESVDYVIADIGMRMLQPHELYRAQGFPDSYIKSPEFNGKALTKTAQVRMVGNSVSPLVAEALVRANLQSSNTKSQVS